MTTPTKPTASPIGRSLGTRLFLLSGGLVLAAMVAAVGFTAWRANQVADQWVRERLTASAAAQANVERQRSRQLRLITRFVASDPGFAAYVAEADPASVRDLLLERQREVECDFMAVLDPRGRVIARTDRPLAGGEDWSRLAPLEEALSRGEGSGLVADGGSFWTVAVAPVAAGQEALLGLLVAGLAVDEGLALDVRRGSGAEVAYVAVGPAARVVASTLGENRELIGALARHAASSRGRSDPSRITVGGRTWAARVSPFGSPSGASVAGPDREVVLAVTLASLDQVLAPFRRIEGALAWVGLLSMLGAFALSWGLSRRVTRPLERLADAAEAAREGRYDLPLPAAGEDEVGRLSRAFRSLLGELQGQREMETYLGALSRSLPETMVGESEADSGMPPGTVLGGRFEILARIGAGAFGTVYRARDRQLRDTVALKTLNSDLSAPGALEGLKEELRVARRITHRNVLRTHDFGEADGIGFISMEYVRGITLRELLRHTARLPSSVASRLGRQLLAGVDAAHRMGVVHRDLKPENLMLDSTGLLRIMDFGIARAARERPSAPTETPAGTPGYLAPEQFRGEPGDVRSDLYACGAILYEMLSGRPPFSASSLHELPYRVLNEDPPDLAQIAAGVPPAMARATMRCLERDPSRRWASAAELLEAISKEES